MLSVARVLLAGIRHFSSSGMSKACCNIKAAMWTSSSSEKSCAEKAHEPIEFAKIDSLLDSRAGRDLVIVSWLKVAITPLCDSLNIKRIRNVFWITDTSHKSRHPKYEF